MQRYSSVGFEGKAVHSALYAYATFTASILRSPSTPPDVEIKIEIQTRT